MTDLAPRQANITPSVILDRLAAIERALALTEDIAASVKLRHAAEILRYMSSKAGLARDIALHATRVRIDAERHTGGLLAITPLHKGGRPGNNPSFDESSLPTLEELGLDPNQSSRWQTMAALPTPEYQRFIADLIENDYELTSAAVFSYARNWLGKHANGQRPERVKATWFNDAGYGLEVAVKAMRKVRDIYHWRNAKIRIVITEIEE